METLPAVADAVANPLARTDRIVMFGGGDGTGASRLTSDITRAVAQVPEVIESLTGINIVDSIKNIPGLEASRSRQPAAPAASDSEAADDKADPEAAPPRA